MQKKRCHNCYVVNCNHCHSQITVYGAALPGRAAHKYHSIMMKIIKQTNIILRLVYY